MRVLGVPIGIFLYPKQQKHDQISGFAGNEDCPIGYAMHHRQ